MTNSYPDWLARVQIRWRTAARWKSWLPSCRCELNWKAGCVLVERCKELLRCLLHVWGWSPSGRRKRFRMNTTAKYWFPSFHAVCVCVYLVIMRQTIEGFHQICCSLQNDLLTQGEKSWRQQHVLQLITCNCLLLSTYISLRDRKYEKPWIHKVKLSFTHMKAHPPFPLIIVAKWYTCAIPFPLLHIHFTIYSR